MNKSEIKKLMLEKRLALTPDEIRTASEKITDKIKKLDSFKNSRTVLFYYPFRNEADVTSLFKESLRSKTVCLPRIENEKSVMTARKILSTAVLAEGRYGIIAPPADSEIIEPDKIDFIVVPLVAYDCKLHRIGYGGGYYDRFLPKCAGSVNCGAAYSFQKADDVFSENHDISLDMVVTEI